MTEWPTVAIGDVAKIFDGPHATPKTVTAGPIFLGIGALQDGRINLGETRHVTPEDFASWTRRVKPQPRDVVFSYETRLGQAAIIPEGFECCLGRRMGLVRTDRSKLDPKFFLYYYLSPLFQDFLRSRTVFGATVDRIALKEFPSFPVALPDLREQRAIADVLGSLDDKIELNRRMNETLEAMAQANFRDWFVDFGPTRRKLDGAIDPGTIMGGLVQDTERAQALADLFPATLGDDGLPLGWRETSLGAVAKATGGIVQTGPFGSQLHQSDYVSAGLPVVMPANLTYSGFRQGDFSYVSLETTERLNKHRLKTGDIVYGRRGDIGRKALIGPYNEGWLCGTGCLKISFPPGHIPAEYLFYSLDHQNTLDWIRARAIGATMPNLNTSTLAEMPLLYPSDASLAAFEQMVKPTLALREENDQQNGTLSATRDLLLPKLMSGEIRLSEAEQLMEAAQ
ncbi:restriction endonuclease subunit S [Neorhizobium sp. AL 9.2.2]|uniref:restriction endonuclease subunit S n=1 Tax=Neorhizobium sp. AL 9.2.2 TaxID=2712894 RepID=UPI001571D735|nr:restriction endonuclease subunit S [Neorhizobium sp. AL 9.2.2]NSY17721.1 hypothetical protein [Neorhizobium sp. AL 9.2.2]